MVINNDLVTLNDDPVSPISVTFSQLKIHLLLNLSRCQRRLGDWELAQNSASDALNEIALQKLHKESSKRSSTLSSLMSSELASFQARAKARKEHGQLNEAVDDLTSALKLNPNNRDIRKMLIKVKEELSLQSKPNQKEIGQNNNYSIHTTKLNMDNERLPIGTSISKSLKYVDDSASQKSEVSSVTYQGSNR